MNIAASRPISMTGVQPYAEMNAAHWPERTA